MNSELELRQKIQNLLFPSGILWDKEIGNYRTFDENRALLIIQRISDSYKNEKEEDFNKSSSFWNLCARRDSNPHASRHQILSLARLPITPRAQCIWLASAKVGKKMELPNFYRLFILKDRQNVSLISFLSNKQLSMNMSVS